VVRDVVTDLEPPFQPHGADDPLEAYIEALPLARRRPLPPQPVSRSAPGATAPRQRPADARRGREPARV